MLLTVQGMVVVLDNHHSDAMWCCSMQVGTELCQGSLGQLDEGYCNPVITPRLE